MPIGKPGTSSGGTSGFDRNEHMGHSVAFANNEERRDVQTRQGVVDRVAVSEYVVCMTCGTVFTNHMSFGVAFVPAILDSDSSVVLGTIGKGDANAGKSAAWLLFNPTEDEVTKAEEWFAAYAAELPSGRYVIEPSVIAASQPEPPDANEPF
jgi:hypothetical protein